VLALVLAFGQDDHLSGAGEEHVAADPLDLVSSLNPTSRQRISRRAEWYERLPRQKQLDWLAYVLGRGRETPRQLDEHVHRSHVIDVLRDEPPRVRELVASHLPPALGAAVAAELGLGHHNNEEIGKRTESSMPRGTDRTLGVTTLPDGARARLSIEDANEGPSPEVVAVVRREFLSRFVTRSELERVTWLEHKSGTELARLIRLLGVRETAVACRGIDRVEAVASFLRRFAPEDARAIAAHIATLTEVSSRRVAFAEQVVREALLAEPEPSAMLDRAGLRVLAITLAGAENHARLRYTAQKLPIEVARWLEEMAEEGVRQLTSDEADARELSRQVAREAESVADGLHRAPRKAK
jgi:hypothetical protein